MQSLGTAAPHLTRDAPGCTISQVDWAGGGVRVRVKDRVRSLLPSAAAPPADASAVGQVEGQGGHRGRGCGAVYAVPQGRAVLQPRGRVSRQRGARLPRVFRRRCPPAVLTSRALPPRGGPQILYERFYFEVRPASPPPVAGAHSQPPTPPQIIFRDANSLADWTSHVKFNFVYENADFSQYELGAVGSG